MHHVGKSGFRTRRVRHGSSWLGFAPVASARSRLAAENLQAPELIDAELLSVLRRLVLAGKLQEADALQPLATPHLLGLRRHPSRVLWLRAWELRLNLSAYDALYVALAEGETWTFQPPRGHSVAWVFVYRGKALVAREALVDELVVLELGEGDVVIEAIEPCRVLLGSAVLHDHPLVLGSHSVHTSREALARGVEGIAAVRSRLVAAGRV